MGVPTDKIEASFRRSSLPSTPAFRITSKKLLPSTPAFHVSSKKLLPSTPAFRVNSKSLSFLLLISVRAEIPHSQINEDANDKIILIDLTPII